jgi:hypothetical protein
MRRLRLPAAAEHHQNIFMPHLVFDGEPASVIPKNTATTPSISFPQELWKTLWIRFPATP